MFPFNLCNKKRLAIRHMKRLFFPTTLSVPSYDMGKYVGLKTYQHPCTLIQLRQVCYNLSNADVNSIAVLFQKAVNCPFGIEAFRQKRINVEYISIGNRFFSVLVTMFPARSRFFNQTDFVLVGLDILRLENFTLLGYYAETRGNLLSTFREKQ